MLIRLRPLAGIARAHVWGDPVRHIRPEVMSSNREGFRLARMTDFEGVMGLLKDTILDVVGVCMYTLLLE